jgi:endonuclease I
MKSNKKISILAALLIFCQIFVQAQIPVGYYDSAQGLYGLSLKTALYNIIKNHTVITYGNLYACYVTTDNLPPDKVWDMYSIKANGTADYWYTNTANSADQCGSYSGEGDCYNREHSTPASWFNDASPMYSDLFNIYPTDGYVNNRRSNYPMAKVGSASYTSSNGSKLGSCATTGYSGTVFEPIDSAKGDFARTFFYMATRYENVVSTWPSNSTECAAVYAGNGGLVFKPWYINMLLDWCTLDPVSQKEINRNNAVYVYQHNRNPFIDHPEWIQAIWGPNASVTEFSSASDINVFPVPANDFINISTTIAGLKINEISFYATTGVKIKSLVVNNDLQQMDVSDLPNGFYLLRIFSDKSVISKELIICR